MGYNARAEPLFCSLNLLFSDVRVAVAVVVILNSLIIILLHKMTKGHIDKNQMYGPNTKTYCLLGNLFEITLEFVQEWKVPVLRAYQDFVLLKKLQLTRKSQES